MHFLHLLTGLFDSLTAILNGKSLSPSRDSNPAALPLVPPPPLHRLQECVTTVMARVVELEKLRPVDTSSTPGPSSALNSSKRGIVRIDV